ncbi:MAG TPA: hypothetical protein VFU51_01775 [Gaiellaceae bacterium]|nr:hypothetical protein [Gaiellaceae bacterium]
MSPADDVWRSPNAKPKRDRTLGIARPSVLASGDPVGYRIISRRDFEPAPPQSPIRLLRLAKVAFVSIVLVAAVMAAAIWLIVTLTS